MRAPRRAAAASVHYRWWVLAVALAGMFSVGFTITILAVAIPDIADELGASDATVTWVVTGPILANALFGPALGRAGDMFGYRRVFVLGLVGAAAFAALIALSWSAPSLILFRVLAAAAGAAAAPSAMAVINRVFPPRQRVQALGFWSLVGAGGPVVGVVLGGPIVDSFGWRWIFVAQVPVALAAALAAALVLPDTDTDPARSFDLAGSLTLGLGLAAALLAINRAPQVGWTSPEVLVCLAVAPVALWAFWLAERRADLPLVPLHYLRHRNFVLPCVAQFFSNFAYMGGFILTPLLLQTVYGYDATETGLLTIARPISFAVAGPLFGYVAFRVGERFSAVLGTSLVVVSMAVMAVAAADLRNWILVSGLALSGFGLGAASPALAASVANTAAETDLGVVGAVQQMAAQVGVVVGISAMQAVQAARLDAVGPADSYAQAFLVGGLVAVGGVVAAAFIRSTVVVPVDAGAPLAADGLASSGIRSR